MAVNSWLMQKLDWKKTTLTHPTHHNEGAADQARRGHVTPSIQTADKPNDADVF